MKNKIIVCLWLLAAGEFFGPTVASAASPKAAPNFVVILADDQGWNGLSVRMDPNEPGSGSTYFRTPNLARLAEQGMRFSQAYSASPTCSPSRHSIQFGRSPASLKIFGADGIEEFDATPGESLANVLKSINPNYVCAHLGKWHVGKAPDVLGYDVHDGSTANGDGQSKDPRDPKFTFDLSRRANEFMAQQVKAQRPFLIQISYYADHLKFQALAETIKQYKTKYAADATEYHKDPLWAAMNENLDSGIGMVLKQLEELGIADNTYVIYTADNGFEDKFDHDCPIEERGFYKAYPQRSHKYKVSEGGIRVPFIVRGPGVPTNSHSSAAVIGTDIFPTVMELAGGANRIPPRVEGDSLVAHLKSCGAAPIKRSNPFLAFKFSKGGGRDIAIVEEDFKLLKDLKENKLLLYNLGADIGERNNLAATQPERAARMYATLKDYFKRCGWDEAVEVGLKQSQSADKKAQKKAAKKNRGDEDDDEE